MAKATNENIPEVVFTLNEAGSYVIPAAETKHGPRMKWGIDRYLQGKIAARFPDGLPEMVNVSQLTRDLNEELKDDSRFQCAFRKGKKPAQAFRTSVDRALQALRKVNP